MKQEAVGIAIEQQIDEGAYDAEGLEEYKQSQIDWIFKWLNYAPMRNTLWHYIS